MAENDVYLCRGSTDNNVVLWPGKCSVSGVITYTKAGAMVMDYDLDGLLEVVGLILEIAAYREQSLFGHDLTKSIRNAWLAKSETQADAMPSETFYELTAKDCVPVLGPSDTDFAFVGVDYEAVVHE